MLNNDSIAPADSTEEGGLKMKKLRIQKRIKEMENSLYIYYELLPNKRLISSFFQWFTFFFSN